MCLALREMGDVWTKGKGLSGMKPHLTAPDKGAVGFQDETPKEEKVIGAR